jgi:hypothetical protein
MVKSGKEEEGVGVVKSGNKVSRGSFQHKLYVLRDSSLRKCV